MKKTKQLAEVQVRIYSSTHDHLLDEFIVLLKSSRRAPDGKKPTYADIIEAWRQDAMKSRRNKK